MTQEDKQLLIKDLCGRLPYGVKYNYGGNEGCDYTMDRISLIAVDDAFPIEDIKPYLRPMSSMTEEEEKGYVLLSNHCIITSVGFVCIEAQILIDWLNEHHFDYRGLISMELALEAPEGMYKID